LYVHYTYISSYTHVSAAAAQQQHLMKQRAAVAAAAASANGVANAANFPSPVAAAAAAAAFNSQAAAAAAAAMLQTQGNTRMLTQATVQALANGGWMNSQNNVPQLHAQMLVSNYSLY